VLLITCHNDLTGRDPLGNYDIVVRVNTKVIWTGRVEGHNRDDGWVALIKQIAVEADGE
jgi:hypothetical protein